MSAREARIARVLRLRDDRLKHAVRALEEARAAERKASAAHSAALLSKQQAEAARRALNTMVAEVIDFIEAEDWLRSRSLAEEIDRHRLRQARVVLERSQLRVKEELTKRRQLELLQERFKRAHQAEENRAERVGEDEIGQRVAQARANRR